MTTLNTDRRKASHRFPCIYFRVTPSKHPQSTYLVPSDDAVPYPLGLLLTSPNSLEVLLRSLAPFQIACLLAAKSLGERVRPYQSLIDKIGRFLEYQQETALACALDCLGSIGGLRVLKILETAKLRLDRWWLRDLYRDAIKRCRESLAAHSL